MILEIVCSKHFIKDLKFAKKRRFDLNLLEQVINKLTKGEKLEQKYNNYFLSKTFRGNRNVS